ncbi:hypothetical protein SAMN05443572_102564 [Myxococcus fulvus]|nr:hypothetical protein SAMN05443572_102564 [Myxococcus fulvus]
MLWSLSGCVARVPVERPPSAQREYEQCLAGVRDASGALPQGPPECASAAWRFLFASEHQAVCRADHDCLSMNVGLHLGGHGPVFVAVNQDWWQRVGERAYDALKPLCGYSCGTYVGPPTGASCREGRCVLIQDSAFRFYSDFQEARCAKRHSWRRELPAWP